MQRLPPMSGPASSVPWDDTESADIWCDTTPGFAGHHRTKGGSQRAAPSVSAAISSPTERLGPPRLEAVCTGVLALYIEELLESGPVAIGLLTADARAALLSVARSKGLLTDTTLALLLHEDWHTLDVAHPCQLSAPALLAALHSIARLSVLDISGCRFSRDALTQLGSVCPQLQVLRYGGDAAANAALTKALPSLLPSLVQPSGMQHHSDSWEEAGDRMPCGNEGRLQQLQHLVWPDIPSRAAEIVQQLAPRVHVNPDTATWRRPEPLPLAAQQQVPADACFRELVGQYTWQAPMSQGGVSDYVTPAERPSLAELFKSAYVERDQRRAAKAERNYKQALARQWRASPSMRAIALAEAGVPVKR